MQTARVEYGTRRDEGTPSGSADASARPGEKSDAQQTLDLVREVLAHMSDAEILDAVAQWTTLDRDSFDAVRDLRVHVERLAEVALGGGTADPAALPGEVVFARSVDVQGRTVLEDRAFHDRVRAIFAVFPTNSAQDAVYARWSRSGDPEFVHFDRYGIVDDIERNYVWLEPDAGWSEGLYQVEIFASDDSLSPLAAGSFEIFPIGSR